MIILKLLIAHLIVTVSTYVWGIGLSKSIQLFLSNKADGDSADTEVYFIDYCLLGFVGISLFAIFLHTFIPLQVVAQFLIFFPVLFFLFSRIWLGSTTIRDAIAKNLGIIFQYLVIGIAIFILGLYGDHHPDHALYHASIIEWIHQFPMTFGIANLHARFGLHSIWYYFPAAFYFKGYFGIISYHSSSSVLLFAFIASFYRSFLLRAKPKNQKIFALAFWLAFAFCGSSYVFGMIKSPNPDFAASIFTMLCFLTFLRALQNESSKDFNYFSLLTVIYSCFAVMIKISQFPVLLLMLPLFFSRKTQMLSFLKFGILILLPSFILFFAHSFVRSGCLVFPIESTCIRKVNWTIELNTLDLSYQWILSWARDSTRGPDEVLRDWQWLDVWFKRQVTLDIMQQSLKLVCIAFTLGFILLAIKIWLKPKIFLKWNGFNQTVNNYIVIFITTVLALVYWFLNAPDIRFAVGFWIILLSLIVFINLGWLISKLASTSWTTALFFFGFLACALSLRIGSLLENKNYSDIQSWPNIPELKEYTKEYNSIGQEFYVPKDGLCWNCKIPCLMHKNVESLRIENFYNHWPIIRFVNQ